MRFEKIDFQSPVPLLAEKTITQDSYGVINFGSVFQYGKINVFSKTPPAA
jgi:hypothetical protein